jgi:hypothetical protein
VTEREHPLVQDANDLDAAPHGAEVHDVTLATPPLQMRRFWPSSRMY